MRWLLAILLLFLPIRCQSDTLEKKAQRATGVILLDFNGYLSPEEIYGKHYLKPSNLLYQEQIEVQKEVAGDFKMFDVTITTDDSLFYTYPPEKRVRCVITDDTISVNMGFYVIQPDGISPYNALYLQDSTPALVSSSTSPQWCLPHIVSHEVGHTLGLAHQSSWKKILKIEEYRKDSSIMGDVCYSGCPVWTVGTNSFGQYQDDTSIIAKTFPILRK